jgi:hypothetical protein
MATKKRTTPKIQKPKKFIPGSAGVPMNPKRRFGCGGQKKSK